MRDTCRLVVLGAMFWGCFVPPCVFAEDAEKPVPKGDRLLGLAVNAAENKSFDDAMAQAKAAGVQVVSLKLDWDDVEKRPNVYESPWPRTANSYYPPQKVLVSLRIATLDTNRNRIPADLRDQPLDAPQVIARFNQCQDWVLDQMRDVTLAELSIGNEVDGVLGTDAAKWKQYTNFFAATREFARRKRPDLKVGVSIMFSGHTGKASAFAAALNKQSDVVMVSYYPLTADFRVREPDTVGRDLDRICMLYPGRPVSFVEAGYPSGGACNSSEDKQRQFVDSFFAAWDRHAEQIKIATFVWMHDTSPASVEFFANYYGIHSAPFLEYIGTLGLRTPKGAGADKPAFAELRRQAQVRGWR